MFERVLARESVHVCEWGGGRGMVCGYVCEYRSMFCVSTM